MNKIVFFLLLLFSFLAYPQDEIKKELDRLKSVNENLQHILDVLGKMIHHTNLNHQMISGTRFTGNSF